MRKLKKISLKELEKEAICLDESELRLYMGGYDPNDCWWRCIAYINSRPLKRQFPTNNQYIND